MYCFWEFFLRDVPEMFLRSHVHSLIYTSSGSGSSVCNDLTIKALFSGSQGHHLKYKFLLKEKAGSL